VSSSKGKRSYANLFRTVRKRSRSEGDMSRTSTDRRLAKGLVANLYAGNADLGWRIIRQVGMVQGLKNVAHGKWQLVYFDDGSFAGFLMVKALEPSSDGLFPGWSSSTITAKDSQINAGVRGPSRTMGFAKWLNGHRGQ
jgi:hypothetical protein